METGSQITDSQVIRNNMKKDFLINQEDSVDSEDSVDVNNKREREGSPLLGIQEKKLKSSGSEERVGWLYFKQEAQKVIMEDHGVGEEEAIKRAIKLWERLTEQRKQHYDNLATKGGWTSGGH